MFHPLNVSLSKAMFFPRKTFTIATKKNRPSLVSGRRFHVTTLGSLDRNDWHFCTIPGNAGSIKTNPATFWIGAERKPHMTRASPTAGRTAGGLERDPVACWRPGRPASRHRSGRTRRNTGGGHLSFLARDREPSIGRPGRRRGFSGRSKKSEESSGCRANGRRCFARGPNQSITHFPSRGEHTVATSYSISGRAALLFGRSDRSSFTLLDWFRTQRSIVSSVNHPDHATPFLRRSALIAATHY